MSEADEVFAEPDLALPRRRPVSRCVSRVHGFDGAHVDRDGTKAKKSELLERLEERKEFKIDRPHARPVAFTQPQRHVREVACPS